MKYKIGDKVKIIENGNWDKVVVKALKKINWIATIEKVLETSGGYAGFYIMEEVDFHWRDIHIERLYIEDPEDLINDRFEILDL